MAREYFFATADTEEEAGYDSDYTDDGEAFYPEARLPSGNFAEVRRFKSENNGYRVVVSPLKLNFVEVEAKEQFFKALYPEQSVFLVEKEDTYRLVLPLIPGVTYEHFKGVNDLGSQIQLFLAATRALQDCHQKGYIVVDLKEDNILYDNETGKSYLIDGGTSAKKGSQINEKFCLSSEEAILAARKKCPFYAPECFSLGRSRVDESMDIYSLGNMMDFILKDVIYPEIKLLTQACQKQDPSARVSLEKLERQLDILLHLANTSQVKDENILITYCELIEGINDHFSAVTLESVEAHYKQLMTQISELESDEIFIKAHEAYKALDDKEEKTVEKAIESKRQAIQQNYDAKLEALRVIEGIQFDVHYKNLIKKIDEMIIEKKPYYQKAKEAAVKLCNDLVGARNKLLCSEKTINEAKKEFQNECSLAIKNARPVLEYHRQWRGVIAKLIIDFLSIISRGYTQRHGLFAPLTNTAQEINNFEAGLNIVMAAS